MPFLDWVNKNQAVTSASHVPYHLLQLEKTHGDKNAALQNLIIQGDNLQALKALLPFYTSKVKCIFIDPPYNTGSAFEHYDDKLEHSQWLSLMYPRLVLLRELLADEGSIWVSIDDREAHYLKVLMDEVFGRGNFVANVVWQKKYTIANDAKYFSDNHDHIIVFSKSKETWLLNKITRSEKMNARYKNPDNHAKGVWKATPLHAKSGSEKSKLFSYQFKNGITWSPPSGTYPRFSIETLNLLDEQDEIWFGKTGNSQPSRKTFLSELSTDGTPPTTVWLNDDVGNNHDAKTEVKAFNGIDVFSTPKPESLIERILHVASNDNDLILDSFLGSGTTAAVAHKMNRRYIGIEMGGHAQTHCIPRLQKVIEGEQGGISKAVNWSGGGGFSFYNLGEAVFDANGHISSSVRFNALAAYIWLLETKTAIAIQPTKANTPFIGEHEGVAYYLLYNGILGDRRPDGGNVLTNQVLAHLNTVHPHKGKKVIFGEASRIGEAKLTALDIVFKQIPYELHERV